MSSENMSLYKTNSEIVDKFVQKTFETVKMISEETPDKNKIWKKQKPNKGNNGCEVYTRKFGSSSYLVFQGLYDIKTRVEVRDLCQFFSDISSEEKHDPHFLRLGKKKHVYYNIFERPTKTKMFVHARAKSESVLVYDRDFLFFRDIIHEEDASYFFGSSLDPLLSEMKGEWPKDSKCVRGELYLFVWKFKRINEETIQSQCISHISPCGWVPTALFNLSATETAYSVRMYSEGLKDYLDQKIEL